MSKLERAITELRAGLPVLETPRLRLRALRVGDEREVFELYADREAVRFGYAPTMGSLADARHVIDEASRLASAGELFHFGVAERERDSIVGHATLFAVHVPSRRAELGYSIVRARWSQGLGAEAVGALVRWAFEHMDLRRLEADVDPRNERSLRLLERLGFAREGYARQRWEVDGDLQDSVLLGLLREAS
jgi:ribosomal-protein-alanine N-acetyltransferase